MGGGQVVEDLGLVVVGGGGPSLLGRDWLGRLRLDWREVYNLRATSDTLDSLLAKHTDLFRNELGTLRGVTAKLHVSPDAQPRFYRPRAIPYGLRSRVDQALEKLVTDGVLEPVRFSEWAAPIVPIVKRDGSIRVCGDYKLTVNQAAVVDTYPLPLVQDIFASLANGKTFTKLDLAHAYQQLILDADSRPYTTINIHKGLFQHTRLPWEWPDRPWARLHIDYAGPIKGKMVLVVVDSHSKWMEALVVNSATSNATVVKLQTVFATHGLTEVIVSDNGTAFTSDEFALFVQRNGIRHLTSAPYHPASNGLAERAVQTLKSALKDPGGVRLETQICHFLFRYRITPHSTTGIPPAELLLGRRPRSRLDLLHPDVAGRVRKKQEDQKSNHDRHCRSQELSVGQPV